MLVDIRRHCRHHHHQPPVNHFHLLLRVFLLTSVILLLVSKVASFSSTTPRPPPQVHHFSSILQQRQKPPSTITLPRMNVSTRLQQRRWLLSSIYHRASRCMATPLSSSFALYSTTKTASSSPSRGIESVLASRLQGLDAPTVWQEFSPLAAQYNAINLGQGFPDWEPPPFVVQNMITSVSSSSVVENATNEPHSLPGRSANQYARSYAHMPLAQALAEIYTRKWPQHHPPIDPSTQVATATGCTNVLYCAIQGFIDPGDEVILFEPAFDIYSSQVKLAGGIPKYIPLRPNIQDLSTQSASDVFTFDLDELQAMITDRTKLIIINTPHNPTGKMFSFTELQGIANIVQNHPKVTVISDEVYEHIIFDPIQEPHISIATILPQQTLTLSSAGKTFSATGWKVGWAIGPAHLIKAVTAVQQWVNFSAATPNQDAMAYSLIAAEEPYTDPHSQEQYSSYYTYLASEYQRKRSILIDALKVAGMTPIIPPGGFFIMADTSQIDFPYAEKYATLVTEAMPTSPMPRDWALSRWLTEEVGVTAIPPSAFYSQPNIHLAQNMLRFAFCKGDATIREAQVRFEKYFVSGEGKK